MSFIATQSRQIWWNLMFEILGSEVWSYVIGKLSRYDPKFYSCVHLYSKGKIVELVCGMWKWQFIHLEWADNMSFCDTSFYVVILKMSMTSFIHLFNMMLPWTIVLDFHDWENDWKEIHLWLTEIRSGSAETLLAHSMKMLRSCLHCRTYLFLYDW